MKIIEIFRQQLQEWTEYFIQKTPNMVLALIVFIIGFYFSRIIKKIAFKFLINSEIKRTAKNMIGNIASIVVGLFFLLIALNILNLDSMLQTLLAGAGVAGLAIGLALQGTLSNTFAGMALSFREDLRIGDQITSNGFTGYIEDINLRMVKLRLPDGNLATIPNKMIIENPIKNYSDSENSYIILTCGVGYESDLEQVQQLVIETIQKMPNATSVQNPIKFFFTEFGDSSINFEVRFLHPSKSILEMNIVKSNAIVAIKKAFDKNNINIPFPIRTLDIPSDHKINLKNN